MTGQLKSLTLAATMIALGVATAKPASATIALEVFSFSGTCTDCVGYGTGTLALITGYNLGDSFGVDNFQFFTYSSSIVGDPGFTIGKNSSGLAVSGILPSVLPGTANVSISDNAWSFVSSSDGSWSVGLVPADYGPSSTWSLPSPASVPEPAPMALLGAGLAALLYRARRLFC
ncbi:MAG: PEP-CTERM sorting domain-containing protein [Candidatus Sulfopaludibacter sp.]|nr:PEP-CTERM sorting domain-containing protein [Candidatus Sulfopaludibacter sp.]